jgi:hypothetical protein
VNFVARVRSYPRFAKYDAYADEGGRDAELEVIARDFEGVPDDERRLMTSDNVAALYGFA